MFIIRRNFSSILITFHHSCFSVVWESHCQPIRESPYFGLILRLLNLLLFWFLFHCWLVWSLGKEDSPGEGNGNSLQYSCLGGSMDRGPWQFKVQGVAKSQTQLKDFFSGDWRCQIGSLKCEVRGKPKAEASEEALVNCLGDILRTWKQMI